MKTLIEKSLVVKTGHGNMFHRLTETGVALAADLKSATDSTSHENLPPPKELDSRSNDNHRVIFVVDVRETTGKTKSKEFKRLLVDTFSADPELNFEERNLIVGDFCWVVQDLSTRREYLLDTIVERKAANDLAASIKETRLTDQKERLKATKLTNPCYLIETNPREFETQGMNPKSMKQQLSNFVHVDGFQVVEYFDDLDACKFFAAVTSSYSKMKLDLSRLKPSSYLDTFTAHCLVSEPIDQWIQQLMCIKGVSFELASAIADIYPSCKRLRSALAASTDPQNLLKTIKYTPLSFNRLESVDSRTARKIGPAIAKQVTWHYSPK